LFLFIHFFYNRAVTQGTGLSVGTKVLLVAAVIGAIIIAVALGVVFGTRSNGCEYIY
jgi:hypothetical protein